MESSLDIQVGGNHYKGLPYQPVKFSVDLNLNFIQGNIVKYVSRYKSKNGRQDLEKVLHYAQLGQELNPQNFVSFIEAYKMLKIYLSLNNLNEMIGKVIEGAIYQNWISVVANISKMIKEYE